MIEGLEFVLIELEKFKPEKWADRKMAVLWLRFLKEVDENMRKLPDELAGNEQIRQAAELCEAAAFTPNELTLYDDYWDIIRVEKTIRESSLAEGRAEGRAIGRAEGEAIGLGKGEAIGIAKGEAIGFEKGREEGEAERARLKDELEIMAKRIAELEK